MAESLSICDPAADPGFWLSAAVDGRSVQPQRLGTSPPPYADPPIPPPQSAVAATDLCHTEPAKAAWWPPALPVLQPTTELDSSILGLALPAVLALAADPLLSIVDTAFVGHLGPSALVGLYSTASQDPVGGMGTARKHIAGTCGSGLTQLGTHLRTLWVRVACAGLLANNRKV